ncbi:putative papain-like cysteine peptidase DUF1796 [Acetobacteraceae bacterium AT-5844]|nr:putative papain-like cysteine peptidase DUF1796 [Acetobacteraceae bacterium AT-5844]
MDGSSVPARQGAPDPSRDELLRLWQDLSDESRRALLRTARILAHSEGIISDEQAGGTGQPGAEISGVFSLGSHCYTSYILKELGYRTEAGPFDWIFSDPQMVADCLEDQFAAFLNPSFYTYTGNPDGIGRGHLHFSPKYQRPVIFNHHDPQKPDDYAYFQRAVARFEDALSSGRRYLFVAILDPGRGKPEKVERLHDALTRRSPAAELLVMVRSAGAVGVPTATWQRSRQGLHVYQVKTTSSHVRGLSHENPADDDLIKDVIRRHATA